MVLKKLVRFILSQGTIFSKFKKRTQFEVSAQYQVGNNHRYTEMHAVINWDYWWIFFFYIFTFALLNGDQIKDEANHAINIYHMQ